MTERSGLPSVLGATSSDECFLAKNSKLDTLYQFAHLFETRYQREHHTNITCERSWWNADVHKNYCYGLDADRFGIITTSWVVVLL